jgi:hypothetical protein
LAVAPINLQNDFAKTQTITDNIAIAKGEAISAANTHTNTEIGKVNSTIETKVSELNTAIEGAQTAAIGAAKTYTNEKISEVNNSISAINTTIGNKASGETAATGLYAEIAAAEQSANAYADRQDGLLETRIKSELIGTSDDSSANTILGLKKYVTEQDSELISRIDSIDTAIAGGVHFIGISSTEITDKGTQTPTIADWTGPVKNGDIVINNKGEEFIWDGSVWQKLGDTTAELERISNLEGNVATLMGDKNTTGSVAKALDDAKAYTNSEIDTLKSETGQVGINTAAIAINTAAIAKLNSDENTDGSVAKVAKDYAEQKGNEVKSTLIGNEGDALTKDTIYGAKAYADDLFNKISAIDEADIIALFPTN